jgi:hypothetical protein
VLVGVCVGVGVHAAKLAVTVALEVEGVKLVAAELALANDPLRADQLLKL